MNRRIGLNTILAFVAALAIPGPVLAQGDLLQSMRQGGSWIEIPIEGGWGRLQTEIVPTFGLAVTGCFNVWWGHSGEWQVEVREPMNGGRLEAMAAPGEGVPFSYRTGPRSRLDVRVRWSEPRDTTLIVWVGFERVASTEMDSCTPVYGTGQANATSREPRQNAPASAPAPGDPRRSQRNAAVRRTGTASSARSRSLGTWWMTPRRVSVVQGLGRRGLAPWTHAGMTPKSQATRQKSAGGLASGGSGPG